MDHFGMSEVELQKIVDKYVITEGNGVSMGNLRYAIKTVVEENNKAIQESIEKMIDEKLKEK
ncbi:MAG TPA: hypothetical protein VF199_00500 [Bacillales bacterium]